jgi:hypothetical protein
MKKSQHAVINPAINIILRSGSGGQGVPPLAGVDGEFSPLIVLHDIKLKAKICIFIFQGTMKNISKPADYQECL